MKYLCGPFSVLMMAVLANSVENDIEELCPGLQAIGNSAIFTKRWYLYRATLVTAPPGVPEYCGTFDTSRNCKCTIFDPFAHAGIRFSAEYSYNKMSTRLDSHVFISYYPYPRLAYSTRFYDFRNNFNYTTLRTASDGYATYFIEESCNVTSGPPFYGKQAVLVFTSTPFPSQNTIDALSMALADIYITEELMYIDQYGCEDIYPASTYPPGVPHAR